jgi:hypothetical protein
MTSPLTLEQRIQRLEDHAAIVESAVRYASHIDAADWDGFGTLFTDIVTIDFSQAGMPIADFARADFVTFARQGLDGWDARQHLSTNHQVVFDEDDDDRAVMTSYMQRTPDGWRIARLVQNVSWMDNPPVGMGSN